MTDAEAAARQAVETLVARYLDAYRREDAEGCAATFTEGARLDHPFGPPGLGRAEIAGIHVDWFEEEEPDKQMQVIEVEAAERTCVALIGWSSGAGAAAAQGGISLVVLHREGGAWRFHRMALVPDTL